MPLTTLSTERWYSLIRKKHTIALLIPIWKQYYMLSVSLLPSLQYSSTLPALAMLISWTKGNHFLLSPSPVVCAKEILSRHSYSIWLLNRYWPLFVFASRAFLCPGAFTRPEHLLTTLQLAL